MKRDIKLELNPGVELKATDTPCVLRAEPQDRNQRFQLTWDRFNRIHRTAQAVQARAPEGCRILDVGGFDGSLALFLPEFCVDVIDPITTGGSGLSLPECDYPVVASIDALEHVDPKDRKVFVLQIAKACTQYCFINYPARRSADAQRLIFEITDNPLVREHVIWDLPDSDEVTSWLSGSGFSCELVEHTSVSQWLSQFLLQNIAPELAARINKQLLDQHLDEPVGLALYDLVIGTRNRL